MAVIRGHQRQLLFMQLQRFASRHTDKAVRMSGRSFNDAKLGGTFPRITRPRSSLAGTTGAPSPLKQVSAIPQVRVCFCPTTMALQSMPWLDGMLQRCVTRVLFCLPWVFSVLQSAFFAVHAWCADTHLIGPGKHDCKVSCRVRLCCNVV